MTISERLAAFVANTGDAAIPAAITAIAKRDVLDYVGVALLGVTTPIGRIVRAYLDDVGGAPQATVLGVDRKTARPTAAFANGTLGHALDFDNILYNDDARGGRTERYFVGHVSSPILPAALAVGEARHVSGRALLTAYVLGVEVTCRVAAGVQPSHEARGFHTTSTLGVFGAVAAAGKLLDLSPAALTHALGIAASTAAGLRENFGTMTKPLHAGRTAEGGVLAALLAARGYTSTARCFEGRLGGFCKATADRYHLDRITVDLGARWGITGLDWKRYPSCTGTHNILDAAIAVAETHDLHPDAIASIALGVDQLPLLQLDRPNPQTGLDAKFSHQFCLALGLLERHAGIADFSDAKVHDPAIRRLLGAIQPFYEHPDGYVLTVTTHDGIRYEHAVQPRRRLAERDLIRKFRECAGTHLDARALDAAITTIQDLDRQPDVATLMARLR
jgi:2-methylcitrate dehydratase PrpD